MGRSARIRAYTGGKGNTPKGLQGTFQSGYQAAFRSWFCTEIYRWEEVGKRYWQMSLKMAVDMEQESSTQCLARHATCLQQGLRMMGRAAERWTLHMEGPRQLEWRRGSGGGGLEIVWGIGVIGLRIVDSRWGFIVDSFIEFHFSIFSLCFMYKLERLFFI